MSTTSQRTRWQHFQIRVDTPTYTAIGSEPDPERALTGARWRMRIHGPPLTDPITADDALPRLIAGATLTAQCLDGTTITVASITI